MKEWAERRHANATHILHIAYFGAVAAFAEHIYAWIALALFAISIAALIVGKEL